MSRESELYRDKIEVSLDGRQIFYLFFGGAVIVGLVFVLGVMVGRRVEARGHIERAHTPATVDPLAALDRLEAGGGLSFQGALRGGDMPESTVEKTIGELAKQRQPKQGAPKAEAPKGEPAKIEAPKAEEPKKADPPKQEAKAGAITDPKQLDAPKKSDEPKKVAEKKPEKSDEPKSESRKSDDKSSDKKPEKKTRYTLQLSSFQDRGEAQAYLDSIKSSGVQAFISEGEVDGKQYFRVRVGTYKSVDAANDAKSDVERAAKKTALVTKL